MLFLRKMKARKYMRHMRIRILTAGTHEPLMDVTAQQLYMIVKYGYTNLYHETYSAPICFEVFIPMPSVKE